MNINLKYDFLKSKIVVPFYNQSVKHTKECAKHRATMNCSLLRKFLFLHCLHFPDLSKLK